MMAYGEDYSLGDQPLFRDVFTRPNQRLQLTLPPIGDRPLAVLRGGLVEVGRDRARFLCLADPRAPVGRS
jgi:hypothetical protein